MQPPSPPFHPRSILVHILTFALILVAVMTLASANANASARDPDYRLAGSGIGVAPDFVTAETTVLSPTGTSAGPAAVESFVDSLQRDYPGARFDTSETHVFGRLMIIDWQGTIDDTVVVNGRTLITIDDGRIARVGFLNLSDIAPVDGEPGPTV